MQQVIQTDNQSSDDLIIAQRRLESWGQWLRAATVRQLGFPNHAAFARLPAGVAEYDDPEAEEIERILAGMMSMSPRRVDQYRALIQAYYFESSTRRGAEAMRVNQYQYRDALSAGENYVAVVLVERKRHIV